MKDECVGVTSEADCPTQQPQLNKNTRASMDADISGLPASDGPVAMSAPIYLDGHASLPLAAEAQTAMLAAWATPANAEAPHFAGAHAAALIERARTDVAVLIGADASEVVFTSGATEANNLVISGLAKRVLRERSDRRRIVVSAIEHKAVLLPAMELKGAGFEVVVCPVEQGGQLDLAALTHLVDDQTLLVSVMMANNEIGVIQPIASVVAIARDRGALIHSDAAQAVGKIAVDVLALDLDYLSLSAHKLYGPQGVGALYVSAAAPQPDPLMFGGGHEGGLRPGTLPTALIAGFGAAAARAGAGLVADAEHGRGLADLFMAELFRRQVSVVQMFSQGERLPGSLSLRFPGVLSDDLTQMLSRQVSVTSGSACNSGQIEISHVLNAVGIDSSTARECIRVFFSRFNNSDEARAAAAHFASAIIQLRLATGELHQ